MRRILQQFRLDYFLTVGVAAALVLIPACSSPTSTDTSKTTVSRGNDTSHTNVERTLSTCPDQAGPSESTLREEVEKLPRFSPVDGVSGTVPWVIVNQGHTGNCRLYWALLTVRGATGQSPYQLMFFSGNEPIGTATSEPRPYTSVTDNGVDVVTVKYGRRGLGAASGSPDGSTLVRFGLTPDNKLNALDPIPPLAK